MICVCVQHFNGKTLVLRSSRQDKPNVLPAAYYYLPATAYVLRVLVCVLQPAIRAGKIKRTNKCCAAEHYNSLTLMPQAPIDRETGKHRLYRLPT